MSVSASARRCFSPLEAALYFPVTAGIAAELLNPPVPDVDYTAVGSGAIAPSVMALAVLAGRPLAAYLAAAVGGAGAALVGFESGRKRAD